VKSPVSNKTIASRFEYLLHIGFILLSLFVACAAAIWTRQLLLPWYAYLITVVFIPLYLYLTKRLAVKRLSHLQFLLLVSFLFLASRLIWINLIPTKPDNDFLLYNQLAETILAAKSMQTVYQDQWLMRLYSLGYPAALAINYSLFGASIQIAKYVNVLLGLVSMLLLYGAANRFAGAPAAHLATVLFVLWPAQLSFTSVLASEHLAVCLTLAGLFVLPLPAGKLNTRSMLRLIAAGVFFSLGFAARTTGAFIFLATVIAVLLVPTGFKDKTLSVIIFSIAALGTFLLYREAIQARIGVYPSSTSAFSLMVGTNIDAAGRWNQNDMVQYTAYDRYEDAVDFAWRESLRRITSNPAGMLQLMFQKAVRLWSGEDYSAYWSTVNMYMSRFKGDPETLRNAIRSISQMFYLSVWILAAAGSYFLTSHRGAQLSLLLMTILGSTLAHSLLEVQDRYHYTLMPLVFILVAAGAIEAARYISLVKRKP
jgi:hypothetical protein